VTYRLREGCLVLEEGSAVEEKATEFYELDGLLPEERHMALASRFPSIIWTAAGSALRCEIPGTECAAFISEFWAAGGTLLSLRREERTE